MNVNITRKWILSHNIWIYYVLHNKKYTKPFVPEASSFRFPDLFSVYLTPNETMPDFRRRLHALEDAILSTDGRMPHTDSGGKRILELAARTGLVVLNTGSTPTFRRPGCEGSIPDVTFASESLVSLVDWWRVLKDFSASDHQYIAFEVVDTNSRCAPPQRSFCLWNVAKVNTGKFVETLGTGGATGTSGGGGAAADTVVNSNLITTVCGASIAQEDIEAQQTFHVLVDSGNRRAPEGVSQAPSLNATSRRPGGVMSHNDLVQISQKEIPQRNKQEQSSLLARSGRRGEWGSVGTRLQTCNPKNRGSAETLFT
ncbi:unnamed protein product [Hermetia illucens]|uniref:Endonuclease/exonuclease/phosphatase domain-containing protein n=1 Tax=Hermetia illucens TaxID=343691 RepID=A0A7R8YXK9_HERIL|nr:unnamed protein product [Hermetia illucens]